MLHVCELVGETIRNMFGWFAILLLNRMDLLLEVFYWIDHVWSSKECVCFACDPSERLDAPSICFVCVFVCHL